MVQFVARPLPEVSLPQQSAKPAGLGNVFDRLGAELLFGRSRQPVADQSIGQNFETGGASPAAQRFGVSFPQTSVSGMDPASVRYNNPGAQYPSGEAARFGQTGYGVIGGGHKIAAFPDPVSGAAANFDLLYRNYTNMPIGEAGRKWTGGHGFGIPGYDPSTVLTRQMLDDPTVAIAIMKAVARREAGRDSPLTDDQWMAGYRKFKGY